MADLQRGLTSLAKGLTKAIDFGIKEKNRQQNILLALQAEKHQQDMQVALANQKAQLQENITKFIQEQENQRAFLDRWYRQRQFEKNAEFQEKELSIEGKKLKALQRSNRLKQNDKFRQLQEDKIAGIQAEIQSVGRLLNQPVDQLTDDERTLLVNRYNILLDELNKVRGGQTFSIVKTLQNMESQRKQKIATEMLKRVSKKNQLKPENPFKSFIEKIFGEKDIREKKAKQALEKLNKSKFILPPLAKSNPKLETLLHFQKNESKAVKDYPHYAEDSFKLLGKIISFPQKLATAGIGSAFNIKGAETFKQRLQEGQKPSDLLPDATPGVAKFAFDMIADPVNLLGFLGLIKYLKATKIKDVPLLLKEAEKIPLLKGGGEKEIHLLKGFNDFLNMAERQLPEGVSPKLLKPFMTAKEFIIKYEKALAERKEVEGLKKIILSYIDKTMKNRYTKVINLAIERQKKEATIAKKLARIARAKKILGVE